MYKAWITKAAKQPMVLETVDLGPLAAAVAEIIKAENLFGWRPTPEEDQG